MTAEVQKVERPRLNLLEMGLCVVWLFFMFRFTAIAALIALALVYFCFPLHRNRRVIHAAGVFFVAALLIPVDVYVPGWNGPHVNSKHPGPRLVRVIYGMAWPRGNNEAILGGCCVGLYDTKWRLVWD